MNNWNFKKYYLQEKKYDCWCAATKTIFSYFDKKDDIEFDGDTKTLWELKDIYNNVGLDFEEINLSVSEIKITNEFTEEDVILFLVPIDGLFNHTILLQSFSKETFTFLDFINKEPITLHKIGFDRFFEPYVAIKISKSKNDHT